MSNVTASQTLYDFWSYADIDPGTLGPKLRAVINAAAMASVGLNLSDDFSDDEIDPGMLATIFNPEQLAALNALLATFN